MKKYPKGQILPEKDVGTPSFWPQEKELLESACHQLAIRPVAPPQNDS